MDITGFTCWSPVSARGPTIPNEFPTKKLLWEKYKKASMGRPKGGEKKEKYYYVEISLTRSEDPCASSTSPILQETFVSLCVLMISYYLRYHGVSHGRSLLKAWDWTNPEDGSAWSIRKDESREIIPFGTLFVYNKRNTCLCSWYKSSSCLWYPCFESYVNGCLIA